MKFKLTIMPAIEVSTQSVEFEFSTLAEVKAAENACANLLLFVQDTIGAMDDYSNMFFIEEFVDGEWVEVEVEVEGEEHDQTDSNQVGATVLTQPFVIK